MNKTILATLVTSLLILSSAQAQQSGVTRIDLQRHDLSIAGREAIQAPVDFAPGAKAAGHKHPGERSSTSLQEYWNINSRMRPL